MVPLILLSSTASNGLSLGIHRSDPLARSDHDLDLLLKNTITCSLVRDNILLFVFP